MLGTYHLTIPPMNAAQGGTSRCTVWARYGGARHVQTLESENNRESWVSLAATFHPPSRRHPPLEESRAARNRNTATKWNLHRYLERPMIRTLEADLHPSRLDPHLHLAAGITDHSPRDGTEGLAVTAAASVEAVAVAVAVAVAAVAALAGIPRVLPEAPRSAPIPIIPANTQLTQAYPSDCR